MLARKKGGEGVQNNPGATVAQVTSTEAIPTWQDDIVLVQFPCISLGLQPASFSESIANVNV